jgi:predicted DNA-binding transcriptional regulator AlpA
MSVCLSETKERLVCTKEAARLLGVSHRTLEDWRLTGHGPAFRKIGRRAVRYAPADLRAFVNASLRSNTGQRSSPAQAGLRKLAA